MPILLSTSNNKSIFLVLFVLVLTTHTVSLDQNINLINSTNNVSIPIMKNNAFNNNFTITTSTFNCALNPLYTFRPNSTEVSENTPYQIVLNNFVTPVNVQTSTAYGVINFQLVNNTCSSLPPNVTTNCTLTLQNGCSQNTFNFNYFDRPQIQIQGLEQFTYNVLCDARFEFYAFEWSNLIQIAYLTIILMIVPIYSRAWSIKGQGVTVNVIMIIVLVVLVVLIFLVALLS